MRRQDRILHVTVCFSFALGLLGLTAPAQAANRCGRAITEIDGQDLARGYGDFWKIHDDGLVERLHPWYTGAVRVSEINDGHGSFRLTAYMGLRFPTRRQTEIMLDGQGRIATVRTYSSETVLPATASLDGYAGMTYSFTIRNGQCLPLAAHGSRGWIGRMQPIFDGDICAGIEPLFKGVRLTAELNGESAHVRYNPDDVDTLARFMDENGVMPEFTSDHEAGNLATARRLSVTGRGPAVVNRARVLLRNCRRFGAVTTAHP